MFLQKLIEKIAGDAGNDFEDKMKMFSGYMERCPEISCVVRVHEAIQNCLRMKPECREVSVSYTNIALPMPYFRIAFLHLP